MRQPSPAPPQKASQKFTPQTKIAEGRRLSAYFFRAVTLLRSAAPPEMRGRYNGVNGLTWALALIIGPSAGMALFTWNPNALWLASAMCGLGAAVILSRGAKAPSITP